MSSAKPPSTSHPVKRASTQRFSRPARHIAQLPQVQASHGTPTRAPTRSTASGPAATTVPDHLVPEHHREDTAVQLTVDDVEIGAADRAGGHPQQHLVGVGHGDRALLAHERGAALAEDHRPVGEWSGSLHRTR